MGNIDEVVRIRKALESLIETPENIPAEAPVHIDELVNIYWELYKVFKFSFRRKT